MCLISFSKTQSYSSKQKLDRFDGAPLWAYVNITDRCSHKCPWCYGGFNANLKNEMRLEDFSIIIEKLQAMKILQVTLSGGEPTEHSQFKNFIRELSQKKFLMHLATHGGTLAHFAPFLAEHGMKQVQVNYQGKELHDAQHGVKGAYTSQREGIAAALRENLEVTATITVGEYNLKKIPQLFRELEAIGLPRLRIWDATGRGNRWRKDIEAVKIFEFCRDEAAKLGFTFVQSYDPEFEGDTGSPCPPMSGLFLHINTKGKLRFCPAVLKEPDVGDFLTDTPEVLLASNRQNNKRLLAVNGGRPWCVARDEAYA
ncbi:MAG: Coenzyme PQQ synthesis protein E [Turneriella sp.]|nr:Coenzyme PQQ synthesis protein E [Turneriella sp.]